MTDNQPSIQDLQLQKTDYAVIALKAISSCTPIAGPLLSELIGNFIPNQRIDRIIRFIQQLESRIGRLEGVNTDKLLNDVHFSDLLEESLRQAIHSLSDERLEFLTSLVAISITDEEISKMEIRHLLRILGEINDIEVILLRFFLVPYIEGDNEFRETHKTIITPKYAHLGSNQKEIDEYAVQESYKNHLAQLGLLEIEYKRKAFDKDPFSLPEKSGYHITLLGELLLRVINFSHEE